MEEKIKKTQKQQCETKTQSVYPKTNLRSTACGFATAALVFACLTIIGMAWMIPMTLSIKHDVRDEKPIPLSLIICYMIFGGLFALIAGILLCVDYGSNKPLNKGTNNGKN